MVWEKMELKGERREQVQLERQRDCGVQELKHGVVGNARVLISLSVLGSK